MLQLVRSLALSPLGRREELLCLVNWDCAQPSRHCRPACGAVVVGAEAVVIPLCMCAQIRPCLAALADEPPASRGLTSVGLNAGSVCSALAGPRAQLCQGACLGGSARVPSAAAPVQNCGCCSHLWQLGRPGPRSPTVHPRFSTGTVTTALYLAYSCFAHNTRAVGWSFAAAARFLVDLNCQTHCSRVRGVMGQGRAVQLSALQAVSCMQPRLLTARWQ